MPLLRRLHSRLSVAFQSCFTGKGQVNRVRSSFQDKKANTARCFNRTSRKGRTIGRSMLGHTEQKVEGGMCNTVSEVHALLPKLSVSSAYLARIMVLPK